MSNSESDLVDIAIVGPFEENNTLTMHAFVPEPGGEEEFHRAWKSVGSVAFQSQFKSEAEFMKASLTKFRSLVKAEKAKEEVESAPLEPGEKPAGAFA